MSLPSYTFCSFIDFSGGGERAVPKKSYGRPAARVQKNLAMFLEVLSHSKLLRHTRCTSTPGNGGQAGVEGCKGGKARR